MLALVLFEVCNLNSKTIAAREKYHSLLHVLPTTIPYFPILSCGLGEVIIIIYKLYQQFYDNILIFLFSINTGTSNILVSCTNTKTKEKIGRNAFEDWIRYIIINLMYFWHFYADLSCIRNK